MDFSTVKSFTIPEGEVVQIVVGDTILWKAGHTNLVPLSTEADGKTIYNGGLGYKDGYRIRSGGAETSLIHSACTGYIPYKKGDKLYIYPPFIGLNTANAINFYNSAFECLGQICDSGSAYGFCNSSFKTKLENGVSVLDISNVTVSGVDSVAFVRINNYILQGADAEPSLINSGAEMIITKNEEITL